MSALQGGVFNVRAYGALGDGQTLDTAAIQAAIDACYQQGGGTVTVSAGNFVTGSIALRDNITLNLEAGAVLLGSEDLNDYPILNGRWEGAEQPTYASLITGTQLQNIAVVGRGTIDGRGAQWWRRFTDKTLEYARPRLIAFTNCTNVLIEGITAINSPSWTINPVRCENVTIHRVSIINPADSPNTDGINPDSCRMVRVSNCYVSVGDDCITIKAGVETEDRDKRAPCENVTITNCTMAHGHGGVVIGSEMSGGVRNVVISNCVFIGTDRGLRFKSRRGRGGVVEDIRISNIVMTDVLCPLTMNLYYACGAWGDTQVSDKQAQPVTERTPQFRRIHLSHITAREVKYAAAFLYGLAEMPVEDITLSDISISLAAEAEAGYPEMADDMDLMQRAGFFVRNARGLSLHHVEVNGQSGAAFRLIDSSEVELNGCATRTPDPNHPIVQLDNVDHAFVHGCRANSDTRVFLHVDGARSRDIALRGNHLLCEQPIAIGADARAEAVWSDEVVPGRP
ncbi:Polygalacturonase [Thermoflexales bacterium]|nr:Polygalacturonase [Thermoflexales bacterium]